MSSVTESDIKNRRYHFLHVIINIKNQKQPSKGVLKKSCSENVQKILRRTPMPKCDFSKIAKQLYWNLTSAWVFSCKFAAYFQNTFVWDHLWVATSEKPYLNSIKLDKMSYKNILLIYYIGYVTPNNLNILCFIINKINGCDEEHNSNTYLTLVYTDESKDTLKRFKNYGRKLKILLNQ